MNILIDLFDHSGHAAGDIIERDAKPYHTLNMPKFGDATESRDKKGNLWTKGLIYLRIEKVL